MFWLLGIFVVVAVVLGLTVVITSLIGIVFYRLYVWLDIRTYGKIKRRIEAPPLVAERCKVLLHPRSKSETLVTIIVRWSMDILHSVLRGMRIATSSHGDLIASCEQGFSLRR